MPRSSTRWCCAPQMQAIYFDREHRPLLGLKPGQVRPTSPRPIRPLRAGRPDRPPRTDPGRLGPGPTTASTDPRHRPGLKDTAEQITFAERRAMAAERDATDRYVARLPVRPRGAATFPGPDHGRDPLSACSCGWTRPALTASCRCRSWAGNTSSTTTAPMALGGRAERGARAGPWACGSEVKLTEATADYRGGCSLRC